MKHLFRLKKQSFSFDKKGMILKGEVCGGDDCFDEIGMLVGMRMRGYFQDAEDDETIDELIWRYENAQ